MGSHWKPTIFHGRFDGDVQVEIATIAYCSPTTSNIDSVCIYHEPLCCPSVSPQDCANHGLHETVPRGLKALDLPSLDQLCDAVKVLRIRGQITNP